MRLRGPRFHRIPSLLLAAGLAACGTTPPEEGSVTSSPAPGEAVELRGHVPAWVELAADSGRVAGDESIEQVIAVLSRTPEQDRALQDLLRDQVTPGSVDYHRWLDPETFAARFGASDEDVATALSWLASQGLRVDDVSRSRGSITFSGTAAALEAALSTEFHRFEIGRERRVSVVSEPKLTGEIARVIKSFVGLSTVSPHPHHRVVLGPNEGLFSPEFTSGTAHALAPADFATIYDLNPVYAAKIDGTGSHIAIVGRSRVDPNDIQAFENVTEGATKQPNVIIPPAGVDPGMTLDSSQVEATLDVTRAGSVAPGAALTLVLSATPSGSLTDGITIATQYAINNNVAPILSISFGGCEASAGKATTNFFDSLFTQAAVQGISVFVASGDAGVAGCDSTSQPPPASSVASTNFLCASGSVTCVGGTEFNDQANPSLYWNAANTTALGSARSYIPEGAWNEPLSQKNAAQVAASGGGASAFITKPSWQSGPGVPADGARDTPDLAFTAAASHDGYLLCAAFAGGNCSAGMFSLAGGTSASTPSMAGIMALFEQKLGGAQGNFNPTLYALASNTSTSTAFHDATVTTSGVATCGTTPSLCNNSIPGPSGGVGLAGFQLKTGFDLVTGWGSLDVSLALQFLECHGTTDGNPCNDNDPCTTGDACHAGVCSGTAVVCTASDQCHTAGTCNSTTGVCSNPAKANGAACNDGNACTLSDTCQAGACSGTAVVCTALDQCHTAGTCNATTGVCSNPAKANGAACNDGNACTLSDTCQAGICSGTAVVCTALDQCHTAGTCNSSTGVCSNPAKANGTVCNDSNACTQTDTCQSGICSGNAVTCTALDQCHTAGTCNATSGTCSNPQAPDGTPCTGGACQAGVCVPTSSSSSSSSSGSSSSSTSSSSGSSSSSTSSSATSSGGSTSSSSTTSSGGSTSSSSSSSGGSTSSSSTSSSGGSTSSSSSSSGGSTSSSSGSSSSSTSSSTSSSSGSTSAGSTSSSGSASSSATSSSGGSTSSSGTSSSSSNTSSSSASSHGVGGSTSDGSSSSGTGGESGDENKHGGCACGSSRDEPSGTMPWLGLGLVVVLGRRRQSRRRH